MKTFMVLSLFLILSQLSTAHCKRYNKKEKFLIVVDDQETGANKFNNYYPEYFKQQNYPFKKIPDPNNLLKFQPSDARSYFWKHKLTTTTTEAPTTTTEIPETTTEMMTTTEAPTTTEMPTETVPSVDYDLSNIPTNYPELLMYYKLCPVNITGKYNPKDVPLPQPIPPPPTASSFNYWSQNQQTKPSVISNQFPLGDSFNADPFTNSYLSIYGSQLPNKLSTQNSYFGDQTYANQFSNGYKSPSTLTTVSNGVQYGPIGEIAGYQQNNFGSGNSKFMPGYLQNGVQSNQQATIYLPPTFSSSGNPSPSGQNAMNDMKDLYQKMGLQVIDLTMTNKNFQDMNGIRINRQLGIVSNTKLSPKFRSAAAVSQLNPIPAVKISNRIPQAFNQFNPNTLKSYGYANLNNNLLYFGPTDKSKQILSPMGTKIDFVNNQRPTLI